MKKNGDLKSKKSGSLEEEPTNSINEWDSSNEGLILKGEVHTNEVEDPLSDSLDNNNEEGVKQKLLSEKTKEQYKHIATRFCDEYKLASGFDIGQDDLDLQSWLIERLSHRYTASTLRLYQASLAYSLGTSGVVVDLSEAIPGEGSPERVGKRMKSIPDDYFKLAIPKVFKGEFRIRSRIAIMMSYCSSKFGLRPSEWFSATLSEDKKSLFVKTAKLSNKKHNHLLNTGRTIHFVSVDDSTIEMLEWLLNAIHENGFRVDHPDDVDPTLLKRMARNCSRIYDLIYPDAPIDEPRITLYSGRHQFASDAKKAEIHPIEVAVLMGHASQLTYKKYYGHKRSGRSDAFHVRADDMEVKTLIEYFKQVSQIEGLKFNFEKKDEPSYPSFVDLFG